MKERREYLVGERTFVTDETQLCPFCPKNVHLGEEVVVHDEPFCQDFREMDATEFKALVQKRSN